MESCVRIADTVFMLIAYATIYDATSTASGFSSYNGVGYHMGKALAGAGLELDYLGPLRERFAFAFYPKQVLVRRFIKKVYNRHREPLACRDYSRQIARKISPARHDLVFSSLSVGSQPVAYLDTKLPIVIWTDSTLASAVGFYPDLVPEKAVWSNLQNGLHNERQAVNRASLLIYSSEWARQEAIRQYQLSPDKVKVVPFGANQEHEPDREQVERLIATRPTDVCRLLFVGMDWYRKGGEVALRAAEHLHRRGVAVELTLVGSSPGNGQALPDYVHPMGLITRRTPEGARKLDELFGRSHFLILASRADASPHVLVEANSYGVPCASSNVGGISSIIRDGANGRLFPAEADSERYAEWIAETFSRADGYRSLARSSFAEYESRLNWRVAGKSVAVLLRELIKPVDASA